MASIPVGTRQGQDQWIILLRKGIRSYGCTDQPVMVRASFVLLLSLTVTYASINPFVASNSHQGDARAHQGDARLAPR